MATMVSEMIPTTGFLRRHRHPCAGQWRHPGGTNEGVVHLNA